jgi:hypothetical protein
MHLKGLQPRDCFSAEPADRPVWIARRQSALEGKAHAKDSGAEFDSTPCRFFKRGLNCQRVKESENHVHCHRRKCQDGDSFIHGAASQEHPIQLDDVFS